MKKIAMRSVRAALQLIPKNLKDKLKQNERLTNLYIKSVRRSGLFFDAPTPKQTQQLYAQWLEMEKGSEGFASSHQVGWQAVVFGENGSCETEKCLNELGAHKIVNVKHGADENYAQHMMELDDNLPTLLLNSGDTLNASAISTLVSALTHSDIVYCDTDQFSEDGTRTNPRFLPDWSPELQFSTAYVNTGVFIETSLLKLLNATEFNRVAGVLTELALSKKELKVAHVPKTLVHTTRNNSADVATLNAVKRVLEKHTAVAVSLDEQFMVNRLCWSNTNPLVSLIIPTKNGKALVQACIESILKKTTYQNFEILLIDNGSDEKESIEYFDYLNTLEKVSVLKYPAPFNYSAINNFGVEHAKGNIIGLINNDIEVITPEWLTYLVGHAQRAEVGCVGAKLLYSDTRIQHAGVVLGYGGGAGHAHKNFPRYHTGYLKRIIATNNYSAVTAACLLVKRAHFDAVAGLNEKDLSVAFNDVDFCLRVKALGVNNVYCAEAELFHHESVSRGLDISPEKAARFNKELSYLQTQWADVIENDPAYSPNLTLKRENFSIKSREEFNGV
ncbi:glycosyltransferase [Alteromonas gracilis]|uniref:glycosyltransferase family 2 protein n=1 Tax=Alteromonas gracilis TaxID=1479524 RepID=UPI0037351837